jgi:hypothetical protein
MAEANERNDAIKQFIEYIEEPPQKFLFSTVPERSQLACYRCFEGVLCRGGPERDVGSGNESRVGYEPELEVEWLERPELGERRGAGSGGAVEE